MGPIETYIRQAAVARGIDPDIAVRVAKSEGGLENPVRQSEYVNPKTGVREQSYGPFQLYLGGGLGNKALQAGIDPRDPNQWQRGVDFALDAAKSGGWSPWYGAQKIGVTGMMGIGGAPAGQQPGEATVADYRGGTSGGKPVYVRDVPVMGVQEPPQPGATQMAGGAFPPAPLMPPVEAEKKEDPRDVLAQAVSGFGSGGGQRARPQYAQPRAAQITEGPVATIDPQQVMAQRQQMAEIMAKLNSGKLWM